MTQQTQTKQLPKGWKKEKLGNNDFKILGSGIEKFDGEKDYLSTESIKGTKINKIEAKISYKKRHSRANMQPILNSVWFAKMKDTLKVYSFDESNNDEIERFILSTGFAGITSKSCIIKYLKYFFLSLGFNIEKDNLSTGSTQMAINNEGISKISIAFPESKAEQSLIVSAIEKQFSRLEEAVKVLKSVKDKLKIYRKAVLKAAFEKKAGWVESELQDICEKITDGTHLTPKLEETGVPMLDVGDMDESFNIHFTNAHKFISKKTDEELAKKCKPAEGDVLISSRGTIGRIGIVKLNQNFNIMGNMILIRTNSEILNNQYMAYSLKFLKYVFDKLSRGVAQKGLYLNNVRRFKLLFPKSIKEQRSIVQAIESKFSIIDKVEETVNQSLIKAEKLRKLILKSAFEGKLVKIEETEE